MDQNLKHISLRSSAPYTHEPLPEGKWIRLLRLGPGVSDDPICCELTATALEEAPPYEPISYCWGDPNDTPKFLCHGQPFSVTLSLFQALRRFRRKTEPRLIWADAVCIDQTSGQEKERQVAFMDQVYAQGECTLIWLGEAADDVDTEGGISLVKEFNHYVHSEIDRMSKPDEEHFGVVLLNIPPLPEEHALVTCMNRWNGARELLDRPWFGGVWVLQEAGLSRVVVACCGKHSVDFGDIARFAVYCRHMDNSVAICGSIHHGRIYAALAIWSAFGASKSWMNDGGTLEKLKQRITTLRDRGILEVLHEGRRFDATLDVDHIYAFLGHSKPKSGDRMAILVEPHYNRAVGERSRLLAERICMLSRSLRLLCFVTHWIDEDVKGTTWMVPSWVPIWHKKSRYGFVTPNYRLDASLVSETADSIVIAVEGNRLRVAALLVDKVIKTLSSFRHGQEKLPEVVELAWHIYSHAQKSPQADLHQFLHTFVGGEVFLHWLASDFVAFCRERCSPTFYQFVTGQPYFANAVRPLRDTNSHRFMHQAGSFCKNRRFFVTERGSCGLGFRPTRNGDILAVVLGCPMPVVLRPITNTSTKYRLVGPAFVPKLMYGNAIKEWKSGSLSTELQEIDLV